LEGVKCCWWVVKDGFVVVLGLVVLVVVVVVVVDGVGLVLVRGRRWRVVGGAGGGLFRWDCLGGGGGGAALGVEGVSGGLEGIRRWGVLVPVPVPVVLGGPARDNGRRVMVDRGGRGRSAVMAVDELVMEVCDGGRSVVTLERLVTDDLARMCRMPGPGPASGVLVPETARREAGTPEEVVGLTPAVVTDPGVRVEVVDGWRMEDARVRRPGGDVSGAGLLSFSRWRAAAEVMRAKTPESGRLPFVAALVVALLTR
jgi:hypothetical protein